MPCIELMSLVDLLRQRSAEAPGSVVFTFLPDGEPGGAISITRGELDARARAIGWELQELGLVPGDRALLLYPSGLEFIAAFFGCLYTGILAVPAYLPRVNRPMPRLSSIVQDAQPSAVLTCAAQAEHAAAWEAGVPELRGLLRLVTDRDRIDLAASASRWTDPAARRNTVAFLQYTSGSTAMPKGVMITHGNLLHNSASIQQCFGSNPDDRGVFWLPLFHDMGLIGGVIHTLYCGGSSTLLSPVSFVQRPIRWLEAITRTRAGISGAPNFAYDLCVEKTTVEQRAALDLSCWRVAFNGAEPVRPETLERFAEAFAPAGFHPGSFLPCYGLAESTLLVSGGRMVVGSFDADALGRGEVAEPGETNSGKKLAGSGNVDVVGNVTIVDPATSDRCASDRVGEIWVSGPSIAHGYWARASETQERLRATLSDGTGPFLRTGDLGFVHERVLFVTGRLNDLIILRGRNIYPQDVEWSVERCHPALEGGSAAAFAVEVEGQEQLAILQEISRNPAPGVVAEVIGAIRNAVALEHDVEVQAVRLIRSKSIPRTSSGKVQRHVCRDGFLDGALEVVAEWTRQDGSAPASEPAPSQEGPLRFAAPAADESSRCERSRVRTESGSRSRDEIAGWLRTRIAGPLGIRADEVDTRRPFASFGIGSLQAVRLAAELEEWLLRQLSPTLVYDYPTIDDLANFLAGAPGKHDLTRAIRRETGQGREPIAIIGIGCRFPGASGPDAFWRLLHAGTDAIGPIPTSRWDAEAGADFDIPPFGGFLDEVDRFDADFFGIAPREAVFVDPQHRLLLETAWEALEDGGQVPERLAGRPVGVFIGIATSDYAQLQAMRGGDSDGYRITGSAASIAANRISHQFDFRGPSLAIDSACSSSLVAVHMACRSLWDGECDLAMAGGVNLILLPDVFASFAKAGFLSPDGRCKTFDAKANGYARGEGVGIVALKPLSAAQADGDPIYAAIRGGAVNQDGRTSGLTAPSRWAQEAVLRAAYRHAGISPGHVDYIEAHGTGTLLGDPVELAALGAVLAEGRDNGGRCAVGSVKSNIGHLEAAAGIAGLIKTALSLHHRAIPASLHFSEPNPHASIDELPLRVQSNLSDWPSSDRPALAGISSFGFGGTNAHVVVEQVPTTGMDLPPHIGNRESDDAVIPFSAQSPDALWDLARAWRNTLSEGSLELDLRDLAYTAGARRGHHDFRLVVVASDRDEVLDALNAYRRGEPHVSSVVGRRLPGRRPRLVFAFSDQQALWRGAGQGLLERSPVFRDTIQRVDALVGHRLGWSLATELATFDPAQLVTDSERDRVVHFGLQIALAAVWKSWGIAPDRVVGDGIGQVTAAHLTGSLTLEDAVRIVATTGTDAATRGHWMPSISGIAAALAEVALEQSEVFVEVGPHSVMPRAIPARLVRDGGEPFLLPSLRRGDRGLETLRWSAAFLYASGFDLHWSQVSPPGRIVRMPSYPWQRKRFWFEEQRRATRTGVADKLDQEHRQPRRSSSPNGRANGHHSDALDGKSALFANHRQSVELPAEILDGPNGTSSAQTHATGHPGIPSGTRRHRIIEGIGQRVAEILGLPPGKVDPDRPLLALGLDSLTAAELKGELETFLGKPIPLSSLLEGATIRDLAERANAERSSAASGPAAPAAPTEPARLPASLDTDPLLSYGQQMLWYAHQFTTTAAAYHVTGAGSVRTELNSGAVRRALRRVIVRHDALRTTFVVVDDKPVLHLLDVDEMSSRQDEWFLVDDRASSSNRELEVKLTELAHRPFDLARGPLFRVHLLSRSAVDHVFLLVFHHSIADFWSTGVFLADFAMAYSAECAEHGGALSPPQARYADFARWQHTMVTGPDGARHWAYWRDQLAGSVPKLELPADFARPAVPTYRGSVRHFDLDRALSQSIVALGQSIGTSLYVTLLTAFQVLLGRFSGQNDIIVGTPVAGRSRPDFQDVLGYFVNLVPMRSDLSGNPPFNEFLKRVRQTVAEGLEHQDYPFGLLTHRLQGNPDPSRAPLFQVMFAHQRIRPLDEQGLAPFALGVAGARMDLAGIAVESISFERQTALFDLTLMTAHDGDRLRVALEYSSDLFRPATIDRMATAFRHLLEAIVADPSRRLQDLPLLSHKQRHQLLGSITGTPAIPDSDIGIHHRFQRQVAFSPDAAALVWGEETLTYAALDRLSDSLAHRLVARGVKPETVVGLYLDRWPSRVIGLLGVLKAGGAYLPLDPDHPGARLLLMLEDSGASFLLTENHLHDRLPSCAANLISFDPAADLTGPGCPAKLVIPVHPHNLAYVVFTSGSTGRPKGVMVSHQSLVAAASAWEHAYDLRLPPKRHLQAAGFSFDVFTGDWVRALATGGTLVHCPRSVLFEPGSLADLIRRERIDCLELVPALAETLVAHLERSGDCLENVRLFAVGSDHLRADLYSRLRRLAGPGCRVVNSYGLTEATIDSSYFEGPLEEETLIAHVPIGRPFPGTRAYVLGERLEPVPIGAPGDLFVGGLGVSRGYVGARAQTAARFLPDPYGVPGSRIYATGDRARWHEDGTLELLGRRDGQVKIRGFRVEFAEIEAVLARHPSVSQAVVVAREDSQGEKRLAAFVVPTTPPGPASTELRSWLKDRLPEPIVPSWVFHLESLPLSSNGKLDRSALRQPAVDAGDPLESGYVAPRTDAEKILARIIADLVGRRSIGVHDNFFEIGVDSIVGIQIVSRARQAGLALDPALLFQHPNVADLSAAAVPSSATPVAHEPSPPASASFELAPTGIDLEAIKRAFAENGGIEDLYPLTPAQQGMLFHTLAEPEAGHYVEQFVCRLRGELEIPALQESWHRLLARHPALRSTLHWTEGECPFQVVHRRCAYAIDFVDWRGMAATEQDARLESHLRSDRRRGFVPSRPPLARLALFRLDEHAYQLVWSVHHVLVDGWCLALLLHEILDVYQAICRGQELTLPPVRPFRDYVAWLRDRDADLAEGHWRQALRGITAPLPLGLSGASRDRERKTDETFAERESLLRSDLTAELQTLGRTRRLTLSTLFQGAWALLLSRYSGRRDVLFGVAVSGRSSEVAGVESMIGMFINVLPLRIAVIEELKLIPWLRELQAAMVKLRQFEAIPLSRIRAWSELPPGMPLFESVLIIQNLPYQVSLQDRADKLGIESARYFERTHYPLSVTVVPGNELLIRIAFDTHRFDPGVIERTLGHFQTVLEAMAADPDRRIVELPSMTQSEQAQVLEEWSMPDGPLAAHEAGVDQLTEEELDDMMNRLGSGTRIER
jgi:amino acid adenylation domain-containing protein